MKMIKGHSLDWMTQIEMIFPMPNDLLKLSK